MSEKNEKKFINETIVGRNLTFRRSLKYLMVSLACGAVFGLAAFSAFRFADTLRAKKGSSVEPTQEAVLPEETEESSEEYLPETSTEEEGENTALSETESIQRSDALPSDGSGEEFSGESAAALTADDVHKIVQEEQSLYIPTMENLKALLSLQSEAADQATASIVSVDCVVSEPTWFDSTVETRSTCSGIILSCKEDEILILTVLNALQGDGTLSVTFKDGTKQNAIMKSHSVRDGLMVLAVPTEGLGTEFLSSVQPIVFSDNRSLAPGMPLIAVGSPFGVCGSVDFGSLSFLSEKERMTDAEMTCIYSDVHTNVEKGTFITDISGNLIGIAIPKGEDISIDEDASRILTVGSIAVILQNLQKGTETAYLGLRGTDLSFQMKYKNIPEGLYITAVEENSPAYESGIRRGDILTEAAALTISGMEDYIKMMNRIHPNDLIEVKVQRPSAEDYKEILLTLTVGAR